MTLDEQLQAEIHALRESRIQAVEMLGAAKQAHRATLTALKDISELAESAMAQQKTYAGAVVDIARIAKGVLRGVIP